MSAPNYNPNVNQNVYPNPNLNANTNAYPTYPTGTTTPVGTGTQTPPKHSGMDKAKMSGKAVFDKAWGVFEKIGVPVNKLTNKIGSEAFWPTSLDQESDKAARILKSFCKDGFYKEEPVASGPATGAGKAPRSPGPKNKPKVLVKIPQKVIERAVGLAIFTVARTGLWVSGAGGSGVLIARKADGSWSPPSGILIHTLGVGFMAGIDIYDCVVVINTPEALAAFSKVRVSLGGELSVVAGPVGAGGIIESEILKDRKPVLSYIKSRGLYGGLQFDGTIIVERNDENARFYGERLPISEILKGNVRHIPAETRLLMEVLKAAEGKPADAHVMSKADAQPTPGDVPVERMNEPTHEQVNAYAPPPDFQNVQQHGAYAPPNAYGLDQKHATVDGYPAMSDGVGAGPSGVNQPHMGMNTPMDGGYAPPPSGAPPTTGAPAQQPFHRTDSGFPAPPPGGPLPSHEAAALPQTKQDPDGPPRYA